MPPPRLPMVILATAQFLMSFNLTSLRSVKRRSHRADGHSQCSNADPGDQP